MKPARYLTLLFTLLFVQYTSFSQDNSSFKDGLSLGLNWSRPSFSSINYDYKNFKSEVRIMINNEIDAYPDLEVMLGVNLLNFDDLTLYTGVSGQIDYFDTDFGLIFPIGLTFYPFENKKLGFTIETAPYITTDTQDYVRGSFGIRYLIRKNRSKQSVKTDSLVVDFDRAYFVTLAAPSASIGFQYSWFVNSLDLHIGAVTFIPYGLYGGAYYHFIKPKSTKHFHVYTGLDVGYGYYSGLELLIAYLPIGFQYIYDSGFTVSLEASAFYNPDEVIQPWFGIKLGKTIMK